MVTVRWNVTVEGSTTDGQRQREREMERAYPSKAARIAGDLFIRYVIRSSTDAAPQSDDNSIISYMFEDRQRVLRSGTSSRLTVLLSVIKLLSWFCVCTFHAFSGRNSVTLQYNFTIRIIGFFFQFLLPSRDTVFLLQ